MAKAHARTLLILIWNCRFILRSDCSRVAASATFWLTMCPR